MQMLFCPKCSSVFAEGTKKCPSCGASRNLRAALPDDMVFVMRTDEYTAGMIEKGFSDAGVTFELKPVPQGFAVSVYDAEAMPTDKLVFAAFRDYERAAGTASQIAKEVRSVQQEYAPESGEKLSARKLVLLVGAVIAFLAAVMGIWFLVSQI